jgi:hypothetical protein
MRIEDEIRSSEFGLNPATRPARWRNFTAACRLPLAGSMGFGV